MWRTSELFTSLREPQSAGACASCGSFDACRGGCMAAKFFTGLPLDGPDPECVHGHGEAALAARTATAPVGPRALEDRPGRAPDPGADARPLPLAGHRLSAVELAGATWPQVEATGGRSVLAVPLGSLEQHGPHLPLDTDTRIAVAVAAGLAARCARRGRGAGGRLRRQRRARRLRGHPRGRPRGAGRPPRRAGAVRPDARSPAWCSSTRTGGTPRPWPLAQARCAREGDDVLAWRPPAAGGDAHAGRTETSLMLAIDPAAVRLELAEAGCTEPLEALLPRLRAEGVRPVSSNGVLGDPAGASADGGQGAPRRPRERPGRRRDDPLAGR